MFSQINNLIGEFFGQICRRLGLNFEALPPALATMNINTLTHVEEFMTKATRMTSKEAELYFFRAGILKVLSEAMAILDLHQDNIMATSFGPLIIDAEVDFFEYSSSNLERALSQLNGPGENRPSTFEILDEETNTILQSGAAWRSEPYYTRYKQGYNFMLEKIKSCLADYKERYKKLLDNIGKVRILPMATGMFSGYLDEGIKCPKTDATGYLPSEARSENSNRNRQEYASFVADHIERRLTHTVGVDAKPFVFRNADKDIKADIQKDPLANAVKRTFDNGTIIAMYVDMDGKIYLDNTEIGQIRFEGKPITRIQLQKEMAFKFEEAINDLSPFDDVSPVILPAEDGPYE